MKKQIYTLNLRGKGNLSDIVASDLYKLVDESIETLIPTLQQVTDTESTTTNNIIISNSLTERTYYTPQGIGVQRDDISIGDRETFYDFNRFYFKNGDFSTEITPDLDIEESIDIKFPKVSGTLLSTADKGVNNGIATLGSTGKIPNSQLPALAITDTFVVNSQVAMLALSTAEQGDVAVRTDLNKSFILTNNTPGTLGNWQELLTPTDSVSSVDGQVGVVNLSGSYVGLTGNQTIAGIKTFTSKVVVDNVIEAPTQISFVTSGSTRMTADVGSISYFTDLRSNAPLYALNILSVDGVSEFKQQMNLFLGRKLIGFSDFSTEKFRLDASNGTAIFTGTVSVATPTAGTHATTKDYVDNKTGWAVYQDTAYTIGSPFDILTGVTSTLPNNAGTVINTQIPTGITSFYDSTTNKITPAVSGDYYVTTIRFKAVTTAPTAGYFDFGIDIGGALGVQFKETKIFAKGAGIEHNFSVVVPMYSGATFIANGGLVKITSGNGNMSVYDINYHVDLVHKAK